MYPNVRAEMARKKITLEKMAEAMDISIPALSNKLSGKSVLTFADAGKIKEILNVDIPLEELFEEDQ